METIVSKKHLIRITDVQPLENDISSVSFYHGDIETHTTWKGAPPQIGDVIETDLAQPDQQARLIGRPQENAWAPLENDALRWRRKLPEGKTSRMYILRQRHLIRQAVRGYLDHAAFTEIDTPLLVHGTTPDIAVKSFALDDRYLVTSTEYQMKRLAIGGFEKIYSLTQNFRSGDNSTYRNPEFTMLEWGRVGQSMREIESDAEGLITAAMQALGLSDTLHYQGKTISMRGPWKRLSVAEAIHQATGVMINDFDAKSFARALQATGCEVRTEWLDQSDFLFSLLIDYIQPQLGNEYPVFITEWPLYQTSSSARNEDDPKCAARSELFIAGIELSDGFAGLADPNLQQQAFDYMLEQRQANEQETVQIDQRYLDAMRLGAPYGAGMAMGFDRLVMLLTDQPNIRNVLTFNWDEV
jgi:elongation factor P--beta-lysine ligase